MTSVTVPPVSTQIPSEAPLTSRREVKVKRPKVPRTQCYKQPSLAETQPINLKELPAAGIVDLFDDMDSLLFKDSQPSQPSPIPSPLKDISKSARVNSQGSEPDSSTLKDISNNPFTYEKTTTAMYQFPAANPRHQVSRSMQWGPGENKFALAPVAAPLEKQPPPAVQQYFEKPVTRNVGWRQEGKKYAEVPVAEAIAHHKSNASQFDWDSWDD